MIDQWKVPGSILPFYRWQFVKMNCVRNRKAQRKPEGDYYDDVGRDSTTTKLFCFFDDGSLVGKLVVPYKVLKYT